MNMRKVFGQLAVVALLAASFVQSTPAVAGSISKNFNTATGVSTSLPVRGGKSFTYTVTGAATASTMTVVLEVSRDGSNFGAASPALSFVSSAGALASTSGTVRVYSPSGGTSYFRVRCSSYTGGSSTFTLADANNLNYSQLDSFGNSVVDYYDLGVAVTGTLSVSSAASVAANLSVTSGAVRVSSSATSNFPASFRGAYTSGQLASLSANPGDIAVNLSLTPPALVISSATTTALTGAWILPPSTSTTVVPIRAD